MNLISRYLDKYQILISYSTKIGKDGDNSELLNLKNFESDKLNPYFSDLENKLNATKCPVVRNISDIGQKIDLIISIRYGIIFKGDIINYPKYGIVNLHSGILPNYRGIMPTFWSMLNREQNIGCTLHYIKDQNIDTGSIISIYSENINYDKSYFFNLLSIYKNSTKIFLDFLFKVNNDIKISTKDQNSMAQYYSYPNKYQINQFLKKSKLFNPNEKSGIIPIVKIEP